MAYRKKTGGMVAAICCLAALVLIVGLLGVFTKGFQNWNVHAWFGVTEAKGSFKEAMPELAEKDIPKGESPVKLLYSYNDKTAVWLTYTYGKTAEGTEVTPQYDLYVATVESADVDLDKISPTAKTRYRFVIGTTEAPGKWEKMKGADLSTVDDTFTDKTPGTFELLFTDGACIKPSKDLLKLIFDEAAEEAAA